MPLTSKVHWSNYKPLVHSNQARQGVPDVNKFALSYFQIHVVNLKSHICTILVLVPEHNFVFQQCVCVNMTSPLTRNLIPVGKPALSDKSNPRLVKVSTDRKQLDESLGSQLRSYPELTDSARCLSL